MLTPLPRRRFLKFATTAPLALTPIVLTGCSFLRQSKEEASISNENIDNENIEKTRFGNLLSFKTDEADILFAFAEGCLTLGAESILTAKVIPRLDEEFYFVSSYIKDDFRLALSVIEYLPIVYGKFSRFSKLNVPDRTNFLDARKDTSSETIRAVIHNLRMAVMLTYYGHESTWQSIQYDGPFARIPQQKSLQRRHYQNLTKTS